MKLALLSDIHANVTPFEAVLADAPNVDAYAIIGDLINYGPRPNEVVDILSNLDKPLLISIWGNHEYSIFGGNLERFSSERGRVVLKYTNDIITQKTRDYLYYSMERGGFKELVLKDKALMFMHGNLDDPFWGKFGINQMNDERSAKYDYVISGHSHIPHYVEYFFTSDNIAYRNKKRTIFINPGSVGQPRNHNPYAQYGILDCESGNYEHRCVWYDVEKEQALFNNKIDIFYKERIKLGI